MSSLYIREILISEYATKNAIIDEIRKGEKGIGMILLENKVENYKRIMEIGYNSRDSFIYRKYVLSSRKHIISKIVENFSIGVYR